MDIYSCQEAFGAFDKTSEAMKKAIEEWFSLYYRDKVDSGEDPCQRIAYTLVSKLVRGMFGEYNAATDSPFLRQMLSSLDTVRARAVQLALVGGESYLKPWLEGDRLRFTVIPRDKLLIFAVDAQGEPTDVGAMERSSLGGGFYTLLERRTLGADGRLTIKNRLFRAARQEELGQQVSLSEHPAYAGLAEEFTYEQPLGCVGLARLCTPMLNCVCRCLPADPRHRPQRASAQRRIPAGRKPGIRVPGSSAGRGSCGQCVRGTGRRPPECGHHGVLAGAAAQGLFGAEAGVYAQCGVRCGHQAGTSMRR